MKSYISKIIAWLFITVVIFIVCASMGVSGFIFPDISMNDVFIELRIPRVSLAFILGAGLALSGAALQTYFRNDLCCPYTLGVSGYASLGAVIGIYFHVSPFLITTSAFIGSLIALVIISGLSLKMHRRDPAHLLLIGIALAFTSSSFVGLIQHMSDPEKLFIMSKWLQGGIEVVGLDVLFVPLISLLVLMILLYSVRKELDLMLVGHEYAKARGVSVRYVAGVVLISTASFIGVVTALCGPIAFIGLFTPHIARRCFGSLHKDLFLHSFFLGAVFLMCMDLISRMIIAPAELPIGIISGVIGAPIFIVLLSKQFWRQV